MENETTDEKMVLVPESVLLSLVADKLKDEKVLFPGMVKSAKEYLKNIKTNGLLQR